MLFNPTWAKRPVKKDVFTLDCLIGWLSRQPAAVEYYYIDAHACLLGQYFAAHGYTHVNVGPDQFSWGRWRRRHAKLPTGWNEIAYNGGYGENSFGAALGRARKLRAERAASQWLTELAAA